MTPQPMTPLEIALHYTGTGWPVFPCRPGDEDIIDPATGEIDTKSAKSPYTSNGLRGATKFERIVRRWWADNPEAMIGVPTGAPIGAWVLDIDIPGGKHEHDGQAWLNDMIAKHGPLPETRMSRTAGGGTHYFWRHKDGVRNKAAMAPGVDTRGDGGYIVAPGSSLTGGGLYEWLNDAPIVDAPDWLLEAVLPKQAAPPTRTDFTYSSGGNEAYVDGAVDAELADLAGTGKGGRGFKLNQSAFSLGTIVGAGALSRSEAESGLYAAAVSNGLVATDGDGEVRKKIKRGLDAGIANPRAIPEAEQDNTRLIDISRMLDNARRKAGLDQEQQQAATDAPDHPGVNENTPIGNAAAKPTDQSPPGDIIFATPFNWIDPKTLPRREFAFGTHYIRKYVSVTVAPGGLGKTANSIVEALSMASGKDLNGTKPPQRLRVWIFNAEDPRDELERRLMAAAIHYKLKPEDFEGRLFLDSGREQELVIAREDKKAGVKIVEPVVEAVASLIHRLGIDAMIVDPFVSTHQVNENDNGAIDKVAKLWAQVANDTNCAIDIVHHLRKVADREATVEDARGAVSLIGAARSVRVLNRMTPEQAKQASVPESERLGMFSITYGKSNLTPLSSGLHWRRLESVPLGNGRGLSKPQDFAPVVTEWKWPSAEDIAAEVPTDNLDLIKARVRGSDYTLNYQSETWVGRLVADVLAVDLPSGKAKSPEHKRIEKMVDVWIEQGHFHIEKVKGIDIKHPERIQPIVRVV
jgi:hypothetical protein